MAVGRDAAALLRSALEHLDVGVLLVDDELRPVVVNRALRRLHGEDGPPPPDGVWPGRAELRLPDGRPLPPGPWLFARVLEEGEVDVGALGVLDVTADVLHVVRVRGRRLTGADGGVAGILLTIVDICDRVDREEQLQRLAEHDELTGVLNRRGLVRHASAALAAGARSVHVVDVDRLKSVNDRHGHAEGDRLLRAVAGALVEAAGPGAVVARTGGDEFAVVGDRADLADRVAWPLRSAGRRAGLLDVPSVSVGTVAVSTPPEDLETLLARADVAMYGARRARRWSSAR